MKAGPRRGLQRRFSTGQGPATTSCVVGFSPTRQTWPTNSTMPRQRSHQSSTRRPSKRRSCPRIILTSPGRTITKPTRSLRLVAMRKLLGLSAPPTKSIPARTDPRHQRSRLPSATAENTSWHSDVRVRPWNHFGAHSRFGKPKWGQASISRLSTHGDGSSPCSPLVALGRASEAIAPLERALRMRKANEPDPSLVADTRFALARALWDSDSDRARTRKLSEEARKAYAKAKAGKEVAEVDAWLSGR
jgi:hypothetical protein